MDDAVAPVLPKVNPPEGAAAVDFGSVEPKVNPVEGAVDELEFPNENPLVFAEAEDAMLKEKPVPVGLASAAADVALPNVDAGGDFVAALPKKEVPLLAGFSSFAAFFGDPNEYVAAPPDVAFAPNEKPPAPEAEADGTLLVELDGVSSFGLAFLSLSAGCPNTAPSSAPPLPVLDSCGLTLAAEPSPLYLSKSLM